MMTEQECNELIESKRREYGLIFENEQQTLEAMFDFLDSLADYTHFQYRFYCWLGIKLDRDIKVNLPFTPAPVPYTLEAFKAKFLNSDRKQELFEIFEKYMERLKIKEGVDVKIKAMIGGSFLVLDNEIPGDLDLAMLVPEACKNKNSFDYHPFAEPIPKGIEIKFLPEDYSTEPFFGYSWISHLGSKPENKTKGARVAQNFFTEREIATVEL